MFNAFRIENFKSYKKATFWVSPLTVLIGANASGKSNALEILRLMSWISKGNKLNAVKYAGDDGSKAFRGRARNLCREGSDSFRFSALMLLTAGVASPSRYSQFSMSLSPTEDDELFIKDERVTSVKTDVPLYEVVESSNHAGHDLTVAYNNFARGGIKPKVKCTDQQAVFVQLESSARYSEKHRATQRVIPHVSRNLQRWLGGVSFLDPSPSAMRDYSFASESELSHNGSNLSGVLYNICETPDGKLEVLEFIKSLPEQDISDISFLEGPRGEVMVQLTETFGQKNAVFDATVLSDGTLRVLSIAALLLSSENRSVIVIEEIDNGVHPSRASLLMNRISEVARKKNLRVIISSHNPALLNAVPDRSIKDVVFCYRDEEDGSSCLVKFSELEYLPELISEGPIGDLMTKGVIERYAKSLPEKERRISNSKEWLKKIA